jgi:TPR repeat protein
MHEKFNHWADEPDLPELKRAWRLRERDPVQGLVRLKLLAESGSAMSMIYIGHSYQAGIGTAKDPTEAEKWYRRAADHGSVMGLYALGRLYYAQKKHNEAKEAFRFGAAAGYAPAMYYLGRIYYFGLGTEKDLAKAKLLFEEASGLGNILATRALGQILVRYHLTTAELLRGVYLSVRVWVDALITFCTEGTRSDRFN